jgi:hypothetical protein
MTERILCTCGGVLVEEVTAEGVRPVGGDEVIPFRRSTDYVVCPACFTSYDVRSLIARATGEDAIEHLQRMAEEISDNGA